MKIKISQIIPDPEQPRKTFDMEKIVELRSSTESLGLIQPITVRPCSDGKYMVIVGERRFRAAQLDGVETIECNVRQDVDDKKAREMQFAENYHFEAPIPIEQYKSWLSHMTLFGIKPAEFCRITGIPHPTVSDGISILTKLDKNVGADILSGRLPVRAAAAISRIDNLVRQREVAKPIVDEVITGEKARNMIQIAKEQPSRSVDSIVAQIQYNTQQEKVNPRDLLNEAKRQSIPKPAPVEGKYRAIVIDPPWQIEKILRDERPNQFDIDYPTMTMDEITDLPIPDLASEDGCHIYLWTTHKHLPDALGLLESWGADYQCVLTWVKNVGMTPFSFMYSTEHCLFAHIGSLPLLKMGKRLDFSAKVREHSRKPDEFYDLVREVSPEPRLDMFGRGKHDGFAVWGNEATKFDVKEEEAVV